MTTKRRSGEKEFSQSQTESILLDPLRSMDNNRSVLQVNGAILWV